MCKLENLLGQLPLNFAEHVVRSIFAHGAGPRPDLEDVVVLDIRVILFPGRRQFNEVFLIGFPTVAPGRAGRPLVVLTLMPQHASDAVGQLGLLQSPQQTPINTVDIGGVLGIALMLIDAGTPLGPVDNKDRDLVAFHQFAGQFDAPVTNL